MASRKKDVKAAERHGSQIWENVVVRVELHQPAATNEDHERLLNALLTRPRWLTTGTLLMSYAPPVATELIPAVQLAERGRSADEVRAVTCGALLEARIDATVRIEREWMVSPAAS